MSSPSPELKPDICNFISLVMFVEQNTLAKKLCPCIRGRLIDCVDTAIYHAKKGKSWQTLFETKCFPLPTHFDMPRMERSIGLTTLYGNTVYCQNQTSLDFQRAIGRFTWTLYDVISYGLGIYVV